MRRCSAGFAVTALLVLLAVPLLAAPASAYPRRSVPTSPAECRHGGWSRVVNPVGVAFRTQGRCTKWALDHPGGTITLVDLEGSFRGTQTLSEDCVSVRQVMDSTYAAAAGLGTPTLAIDACLDTGDMALAYTGTFTVTTGAGNVSGTVTGAVQSTNVLPLHSLLTLTVTSATGQFSTANGALAVDVAWMPFGPTSATSGTVVATTLVI